MARFIDRGAIIAGWVGAGMAMVIVIALELIIPIQPLVLLAAIPAGAVIGAYANVRSQRRRPAQRVVGNALYAGALTGLTLAVLYVAIRLLFIYADTGVLPDGTRLDCATGPACVYAREVADGKAQQLVEIGVTDAAGYEAAKLAALAEVGLMLVLFTLAGAMVAGGFQALSGRGRRQDTEGEEATTAA
ncbi:hypothetical protein BH23CHL7_BH23CHL7_15450 [soil metagenome]